MNSKIAKSLLIVSLSFFGLDENSTAAEVCSNPIPETGYMRNFQELALGTDQWLFREHDLITEFGPNRIGYNGLRELNSALEKRGTELVIVPLPTRGIVHPEKLGSIDFEVNRAKKNYSNYLGRLRKVGLSVPDFTQLTNELHKENLYFARDHHWTPRGAEATAKIVANFLKDKSSLSSIPVMSFTTTSIDFDSTPGSYSRAALELCDISYPAEDFEVVYTESELDLFAEVEPAKVVLVGTSNSNGSKDFNFSGYLRQNLEVDVLNMALSGGGFDESLLEYLKSAEFRSNPPKVLIWEVPGYYSLNQGSFYESIQKVLGE